jgi:hypothetical protein
MREAFRWANSDSSYFVKEAYRRLLAIPGTAIGAVVRRLEKQGERDYRFLSVVALYAMEQRDWERAMGLLHAAADRNWADLFIERQRILCEQLRQEAEPEKSSTFAGLAEHLAYQVLYGSVGKHGDYFVGNGDRANGKRLFLLPGVAATGDGERPRATG